VRDHLDIIQTLKSFSSRGSVFTGVHNESVSSVLLTFRDLCSIVWMMERRDSLSLALRKKALGVKPQVYGLIFFQ